MSTFKNFVIKKSKEKQTSIKSKSKKSKMDKFVTKTIGTGSASSGVRKPVKGKSITLPLKENKHAHAQTVLDKDFKKRRSYDRTRFQK